jgi:hypothetical protein
MQVPLRSRRRQARARASGRGQKGPPDDVATGSDNVGLDIVRETLAADGADAGLVARSGLVRRVDLELDNREALQTVPGPE